MKYLPMFEITY